MNRNPVELAQALIRFDTSNPPGNEAACVAYVNNLLMQVGVETTLLVRSPRRPNLIARLPGEGRAPPLLLYGHVDVVPTTNQPWSQPPFEGVIEDEYLWGRGALDMKGGVAMMLAAFLRAKDEGLRPAGDILFVLLSDEEGGGDDGAKFLVAHHAEQFAGVRYAIGEFGGFTLHVGGQRFYPIQVAEKQICWMKLRVSGPAGHGSLPMRGGAMAKMGRLLQQLDHHRLPVHVTAPARVMIEGMAAALPMATRQLLRQLLIPTMTDRVLDILGERARPFDPLLHNTVNATIIQGGEKNNVIPSEIIVELDGRLLPGHTPHDIVLELRAIIGDEVDLEVVRYDPGPPEPDMGWFDALAEILREADPGARPIPFLMPGVSDARFFGQLGIQTYGFLPMKLPETFNFIQTIHAADERIPVAALEFGSEAIYEALRRYHVE